MNENLMSNSTKVNSLSQSYSKGIHGILQEEQDFFDDFQLPLHLIEKRKKIWSNLFDKYSANTCQIELNVMTMLPVKEDNNNDEEKRLPMRKSMSVVQQWINTGNLYDIVTCKESQSDSGSSLNEELLEPHLSLNSLDPTDDSSLEKHPENPSNVSHQYQKLTSSSDSSVNTAVYILANNDANKKAVVPILSSLKRNRIKKNVASEKTLVNCAGNTNKFGSNEKIGRATVNGLIENNFGKNVSSAENCNLYKDKSVGYLNISKDKKEKSTEYIKRRLDSFLARSSNESSVERKRDNPQIASLHQNHGSRFSGGSCGQTTNSTTKLLKRKKLYNYSESLAEFTPSECNMSFKIYDGIGKKCEHPALEIKSSKKSRLGRKKKIKRKRKSDNRQFIRIKSNQYEENQSVNVKKLRKKISNDISQLRNFERSRLSHDTPNNTENYNELKNKLKLKYLSIILHKLPYIYAESSQENNCRTKNTLILKQASNCHKNYSGNKSKSDTLLSSQKKLFNSVNKFFTSNTTNYKSFIDAQSDENVKFLLSPASNENKPTQELHNENSKNKSKCLSVLKHSKKEQEKCIKPKEQFSFEKSMVPKKEESLYLVNEPSKFVIALSSDESDETSDKNYNTRRKASTVTVVHQKISEPLEFKRSSSCKVYNSKQNDFKKPQSCLSDAISTKRLNKCFKNRVSKTVGSDEHSLESRKISENNCLDNQNLVTFAQIKNNQLSSTIFRSVEESTTKIKKKDFLLANGEKGSLLKKSIDKMSLKKRKKSVDCSDEDDIFVPLSKKPPTNESESEDKTCNNVPLVNKGIQLYESNNNFNSADNMTSKENLNPIKACRRSLMYYKKNSDDKYTKKLRTRLKRTDYRSSSEVCVSSDEEYFVPLKMYG